MDNQKGFTLVELLIYLAIMGVVAVSLVQFGLSVMAARSKTYVAQEVQANARLALEMMSRKIKMASGVNTGASVFKSDPGVLSLVIVDGTKDTNPTVFDLDGDDGRLQMTEGSGPTGYLTSDEVKVTSLMFTDLTGNGDQENIKIEMSIAYDSTNDVIYGYAKDYQTSVSVRK
jgi:prepilin-type N-terminal cleavage/methylation domain-containing protein